jgi:dihydroneopterin aldolase
MDKIFISNLLVNAIIGVNNNERETQQGILINVILFADTHPAAQSDDVTKSMDYAVLAKKIRTQVESARRFTVEATAEDIAVLCLSEPIVRKVIVRVEKPEAVKSAESVGVEIERRKT